MAAIHEGEAVATGYQPRRGTSPDGGWEQAAERPLWEVTGGLWWYEEKEWTGRQ